MSIIRIPVSLKMDDTSSFFNDFVLPMRNDKELSEFIVSLMKAYYSNDDIKVIVDAEISANSPIAEIRKQIDRIQMEHNKSMMTASMITHQVEGAQNLANDGVKATSMDNEILTRIASTENLLSQFGSTLTMLMSAVQGGQLSPLSAPAIGVADSNQVTQVTAPVQQASPSQPTMQEAVPVVEEVPPVRTSMQEVVQSQPVVQEVVPAQQIVQESVPAQPAPTSYMASPDLASNTVPNSQVLSYDTTQQPENQEILFETNQIAVLTESVQDTEVKQEGVATQSQEATRKRPSSFGKALSSLRDRDKQE